ncbi:MAG: gephyrin-like molybdotransferase Glp [Rufibacter sp.]
MLSFEDARETICSYSQSYGIETLGILYSVGRVLAQEVRADRDLPPFDRATMDGIALNTEEVDAGTRLFTIAGVLAAGSPQATLPQPNRCLEIMTGAVLPRGANAVVPYEQCALENNRASILASQVKPGQNIHRQGSDGKAGQLLLSPGTMITPAIIGLLASVGLVRVQVAQLPKVVVCSTGDELVEISQTPLPHQIRRSNAYMLAAALRQEHLTPSVAHLPDDQSAMKGMLKSLLQEHEVILLSGAVSKGKFDFLPQVLRELGMTIVLHSVAQKPGKPLLFGVFPDGRKVFGLPGNPVSTFTCYHLFFKPWLHASLGLPPLPDLSAPLAKEVVFKPSLTYHLPVTFTYEEGLVKAQPIASTGSGDLTSLLKAQALLSLPAQREVFAAGDSFPYTWL